MISFKVVRWKNFLSTGNALTEIQLDRTPTTLIVGDNGSGKSTLLDALTFALFNKPFRNVNKTQLVNSVNGNKTHVEVEFKIGTHNYLVRRGIKPNIFEIYRDDTLINQDASVRDQQDHLERNILKFNFKSFTQIVILGSSSFVPFMQLKPADRREVIEDLLDLNVFSEMNVLLKARNSELKTELIETESSIGVLESRIEGLQRVIEKTNQNKQDKIDELKKEIKTIKDNTLTKKGDIEKTNQDIQDLETQLYDLETVNEDVSKVNAKIMTKKDTIKGVRKNIKFFDETDVCPTCEQDITSGHKDTLTKEFEAQKDTLQKQLDRLTKKEEKLSEKVAEYRRLREQLSKLYEVKNGILGEVKHSMSYIKTLEQRIEELTHESEDSTDEETELADYQNKLDKANQDLKNQQHLRTIFGYASDILKDGGIKAKIIHQYVPLINELINKYLAEMEFFVEFELDETFNETIKSRHRDEFSYSSFSEGEKMRIDMSLLLCWRKIATLKNSVKTNLLILDEIFDSSLDHQGIDDVMKLLKSVDSHVYIISHKGDALLDKFDRVLKYDKPQNYSMIVDETFN